MENNGNKKGFCIFPHSKFWIVKKREKKNSMFFFFVKAESTKVKKLRIHVQILKRWEFILKGNNIITKILKNNIFLKKHHTLKKSKNSRFFPKNLKKKV